MKPAVKCRACAHYVRFGACRMYEAPKTEKDNKCPDYCPRRS